MNNTYPAIEDWAIENLALRIIRPETEDYADKVTSCNITPILELMNEQYKQYIDKIIQNYNHCLQKNLLKHKQAAPTRLTRPVKNSSTKPSTSTKLRYKSQLIQCWVPEYGSLVAFTNQCSSYTHTLYDIIFASEYALASSSHNSCNKIEHI